ncbi:MAG: response regulator [Candidatus Riflebacteria bacterium]
MRDKKLKQILIIDDEEAIVLLLETILGVYDYQSISCMQPENAVALARSKKPDLIILDIAMPGIDGYEICSTLKSSPETSSIPVLMVTALALSQDKKRGLECGANGFVFKPFDPQMVISEIEKLLS